MAYLGMAIAIGISALSLTVATVAGALDRKRTFALLRLGGMPSGHLRRVIATEAAVPLAATLAMSAGLGFFVAWVMLVSLGNENHHARARRAVLARDRGQRRDRGRGDRRLVRDGAQVNRVTSTRFE